MRLIDADELIKALKRNCTPELCHDYNTDWCEKVCPHNHFEDLIDNAPTVAEVFKTGSATGLRLIERPHGKWEEDWQEDLDFMSRKGWKCPFCKWRTTYGESNFCMNCGADLREGGAE